jgi:hypothetical protein
LTSRTISSRLKVPEETMAAKTKSPASTAKKAKNPKTGDKVVRADVARKTVKGGDEEIPKALALFLEVYGRL